MWYLLKQKQKWKLKITVRKKIKEFFYFMEERRTTVLSINQDTKHWSCITARALSHNVIETLGGRQERGDNTDVDFRAQTSGLLLDFPQTHDPQGLGPVSHSGQSPETEE